MENTNKIKQALALLNLTVKEEFIVNNFEETKFLCYVDEFGQVYGKEIDPLFDNSDKTFYWINIGLAELLSGAIEIKHLPFKPQNEEDYFFVDFLNGEIIRTVWTSDIFDYYCYNAGNCFKSSEIAKENAERICENYQKN